jgi:hypothetical protein
MAVVVSVPIADGTGLLVERRLLCLGFQGVEVDDVRAIVGSNAFREWVADRLHKRLACLRRRAICVTAARAAVDEAIARHLIGVGWPVELQTGLFDRRNERAFVTARDEALAIERSMLIQRHNSNLSCDLDIAAPSLELIVSW